MNRVHMTKRDRDQIRDIFLSGGLNMRKFVQAQIRRRGLDSKKRRIRKKATREMYHDALFLIGRTLDGIVESGGKLPNLAAGRL